MASDIRPPCGCASSIFAFANKNLWLQKNKGGGIGLAARCPRGNICGGADEAGGWIRREGSELGRVLRTGGVLRKGRFLRKRGGFRGREDSMSCFTEGGYFRKGGHLEEGNGFAEWVDGWVEACVRSRYVKINKPGASTHHRSPFASMDTAKLITAMAP